jgi:hypothetical protein
VPAQRWALPGAAYDATSHGVEMRRVRPLHSWMGRSATRPLARCVAALPARAAGERCYRICTPSLGGQGIFELSPSNPSEASGKNRIERPGRRVYGA